GAGRPLRVRGPDHGGDLLAPVRVGDAEDDRLRDAGVAGDRGLDLARIDVLPAADDEVLEAAGDGDVAALVHDADVAGVQPAVGVDGLRGRVGQVVVAEHDLVAAGADLARLPDGQRRAVRPGDLHLDLPQRRARRVQLVVRGVVRAGLGDDG